MTPLSGGDGVTIYNLHFVGGPHDGVITNGIRPYFAMQLPDGSIYASERDADGGACLEWIDDWTRRITLRFVPGAKSLEAVAEE